MKLPIDLDLICQECGSKLAAKINVINEIEVQPCQDCLNTAKAELEEQLDWHKANMDRYERLCGFCKYQPSKCA